MCRSEHGGAILLESGVLVLAVDLLQKFKEDGSVVPAVCGLMEALLATGEGAVGTRGV